MGLKQTLNNLFNSGGDDPKDRKSKKDPRQKMVESLRDEIQFHIRNILKNEYLPIIKDQIEFEFKLRASSASTETKRLLQEEIMPELLARIERQIDARLGAAEKTLVVAPEPPAPVSFAEEFPEIEEAPAGPAVKSLQTDHATTIEDGEPTPEPASIEFEPVVAPDPFVADQPVGSESVDDLEQAVAFQSAEEPEPLEDLRLLDAIQFEDLQPIHETAATPDQVQKPLNQSSLPEAEEVIDSDFLLGLMGGADIVEEILPLEEVTSQVTPERSLRSFKDANIRVGIDFGTSTTAVSIKVGGERAVAIPIGNDGVTRYIPSVVYISPRGGDLSSRILVGEVAESQADETNKIRSIKRCFGCNKSKACPILAHMNDQNGITGCLIDRIQVEGNEPVSPGRIAYFIVREALFRAVNWARDNWGIDVNMENITQAPLNFGCGASYSLDQRKVFVEIGRELGFSNVSIDNVIEEPVLAGFAFARFAEKSEGFSLLYDFGGGTLDVAVIDVTEVNDNERITVISTAGDNWLGGDDIDTKIYDDFFQQVKLSQSWSKKPAGEVLTYTDKSKLRTLAKKAKEGLSTTDNFHDVLITENLGSFGLELSLNRFEQLLEQSKLINRSLDQVLDALRFAQALEKAAQSDDFDEHILQVSLQSVAKNIERVILVGGVTRIPYVRRKLEEVFGKDKIVSQSVIEPVSAVAIGASYPKEQQHFSITNPPFGFELGYFGLSNPHQYGYFKINEPYQHYKFFDRLKQDRTPRHWIDFTLPNGTSEAKVFIRIATTGELVELFDLTNRNRFSYKIEITLDGSAMMRSGDLEFPSKRLPLRHPLQDLIFNKKEDRHRKQIQNMPDTTFADDLRKMMLEN